MVKLEREGDRYVTTKGVGSKVLSKLKSLGENVLSFLFVLLFGVAGFYVTGGSFYAGSGWGFVGGGFVGVLVILGSDRWFGSEVSEVEFLDAEFEPASYG